jgi:hypothetical protein
MFSDQHRLTPAQAPRSSQPELASTCFDDHSRGPRPLGRRVEVHGLPFFRRIHATELQDRFGVELLLGMKVIVEPAARQSRGGHDFVDRDFRQALSVEQPARAPEDALARLAFVLG